MSDEFEEENTLEQVERNSKDEIELNDNQNENDQVNVFTEIELTEAENSKQSVVSPINTSAIEPTPLLGRNFLVDSPRSKRHEETSLIIKIKKIATVTYLGCHLSLRYLYAESRRGPLSMIIGMLTVILVVFVIALLQTSVNQSPIIFMKIAENSVGENDLIITAGFGLGGKTTAFPSDLYNLPLLNETFFEQSSKSLPETRSILQGPNPTPRWLWLGDVVPNSNTVKPRNQITPATSILLGISSLHENSMELGRSWGFGPLGYDECIVTGSIVRQIGLVAHSSEIQEAVGENIIFRSNIPALYNQLAQNDASSALTSDSDAQASAASSGQTQVSSSAQNVNFEKFLIQLIYPDSANFWNQTVDTNVLISIITGVAPSAGGLNFTQIVDALGLQTNENITFIAAFLDSYLPNLKPLFSEWNSTRIANDINSVFKTNINASQVDLIHQYLINEVNKADDGSITPPDPNLPNPDPNNAANDLSNNSFFRFLINIYRLYTGTETYGQLLYFLSPIIAQFLTVDIFLTIRGVVEEPDGKWSNQLGSVVVVENEALAEIIQKNVNRLVNFNETTISLGTISFFGFDFGTVNIPTPAILLPKPDNQHTWPARVAMAFGLNNSAIVKNIDNTVNTVQHDVNVFTPLSYSMLSVFQYTNRLEAYMSSLDTLKHNMIVFTNGVSEAIGYAFPVTYTLPITLVLQQTIYIRYFLDNIFGSVIAMLVGLGSLLVFSLLLNDVKGKTYEYGMLRALGMPSFTLIQLLSSKAIIFSVPAIGIGLFLAWLLYIPVAVLVANFAHLTPNYNLNSAAIIIAVVIGFIMPLIANIVPIFRAFSSTLRDSLDLYHHVTSEVIVTVQRLSELGLDLWQTAIALLLIVFGFITFYIIPYAFTFNNIPLFLGVLNGILLAMLVGLCVVASILQPYLERLILFCIAFYRRSALLPITRKNLASHRERNSKTATMFTISLAFLIFAAAMFDLQARELGDNVRVFNGADLSIQAPLRNPRYALRESEMTAFLKTQLSTNGGYVANFTYVSFALNYMRQVTGAGLSNLPQQPVYRSYIYGVQENYLDVAYSEFLMMGEENNDVDWPSTTDGNPNPIKLLFTDAGNAKLPQESRENGGKGQLIVPKSIGSGGVNISVGSNSVNLTSQNDVVRAAYTDYLDVLVTYALKDAASVHVTTPLQLTISAKPPGVDPNIYTGISDNQYHYLAKARAMLIKCPGFIYSSYRQLASTGPLLMRMDSYQNIINRVYGFNFPIPKYKLLVRFIDGTSDDARNDVINGLRTFISSSQILVIDTIALLGQLNSAVAMLQLFFVIIGLLAMFMCAVMLWLSFKSNVEESSWELAVLRSCGLNKSEIVMVYVYESASLVLSSVVMGSIIGLLISISLTAQFIAFLEMPFRMVFPYTLFFVMLALAIFVAAVGSYLPAREILKAAISNVLRRA